MARKLWMMLAMLVFVAMGTGCGSTPVNISVQLDKSIQEKFGANSKVLVDIVGVKNIDDDKWRNLSMTEYFASPNDTQGPRATPMRKTLTLNSGDLSPRVLTAGDAMWGEWLKDSSTAQPTRIYVLVQMPGAHQKSEDKAGNEDPRRAILSTNRGDYHLGWFDGAPTVHLVIRSTGVHQQ